MFYNPFLNKISCLLLSLYLLAPNNANSQIEIQNFASLHTQLSESLSKVKSLHLTPGVYHSEPKKENQYPIGDYSFELIGTSKSNTIIKRPNNSLGNDVKKDFSYGVFFIPAPPTTDELKTAVWKKWKNEKKGEFIFTIITRGTVLIKNLTFDCNMQNQGIEKGDLVEHSAMLGFAGKKYELTEGEYAGRTVFVAFKEVVVMNVHFINGGWADDLWVSRGYFRPNILYCHFENITSANRVHKKRGTITFSSPAKEISIKNCTLYRLELEESTIRGWKEAPSMSENPEQSNWELKNIETEYLDLASKGQSCTINADSIKVNRSTALYQLGGIFKNSNLHTTPKNCRLNRLNNMVFENVNWTFQPNEKGEVKGIKLVGQYGIPCKVKFINNRFMAEGDIKRGVLIDSEYSRPDSEFVDVSFINCTFDERFGKLPDTMVANISEKGNWKFEKITPDALRAIRIKERINIKVTVVEK